MARIKINDEEEGTPISLSHHQCRQRLKEVASLGGSGGGGDNREGKASEGQGYQEGRSSRKRLLFGILPNELGVTI